MGSLRMIGTLALLCMATSFADAAPITVWNFNNTGSPATLFAPSLGAGTMSSNFASANIVNFGGTTINAQGGDIAGQALALQGGIAQINNGSNLTFSASTVGFDSIMVSLAIQRTSTGFNSDQFQYSLDGVTYSNFGAPFTPPSSFGVTSFDLSSIAGVANNPNASFRIVFNGVTSDSGNNRIDNVVIAGSVLPTAPGPVATPEPMSVTVFGVCLLGLAGAGAWRRRFAAR